jgi:succinate--hydroxymethylglutarate CoA-transferase
MRVIAIEQYGAGPYGTMQLADLGAEVIKIENPSEAGDMSRRVGPFFLGPDDSHFFESFNRNKKSVTLDLKREGARDVPARPGNSCRCGTRQFAWRSPADARPYL